MHKDFVTVQLDINFIERIILKFEEHLKSIKQFSDLRMNLMKSRLYIAAAVQVYSSLRAEEKMKVSDLMTELKDYSIELPRTFILLLMNIGQLSC